MKSALKHQDGTVHAAVGNSAESHERLRIPLESGIPPRSSSPDQSFAVAADERIQHALAEGARVDANLTLLLRGLQRLVAGGTAVEGSNAALCGELDRARELLAHAQSSESALGVRVRMLEQTLARARAEAAKERGFLIEQHDAFLKELLGEHAREVAELHVRLSRALEASEFIEASDFLEVSPIELEDLDSAPSAAASVGSAPRTPPASGAAPVPRPSARVPPLSMPPLPPPPHRLGPPKLPDPGKDER
jgi:hypothetical protein